jgi:hypothetical protein
MSEVGPLNMRSGLPTCQGSGGGDKKAWIKCKGRGGGDHVMRENSGC